MIRLICFLIQVIFLFLGVPCLAQNNNSANVPEISDINFDKQVLQSKKPVLVEFYANWCGDCISAKPIIEELNKNSGLKYVLYKINYDRNKMSIKNYNITEIPTLILFKNGKNIFETSYVDSRVSGLIDKALK